MVAAARALGLDEAKARELALATCGGSAALALQSSDSPTALREKVTSKGGTTHAAITSLQADGVHLARYDDASGALATLGAETALLVDPRRITADDRVRGEV